jgi:RNA polymerase primary sigma factor
MAVKKSKPAEAPAKKASATKTTPKPKKAASKTKAAAPVVATDTASKAETPKASAAPKKAASAAPKKTAAPLKLTEKQLEFLKQIKGAAESGYMTAKKAEQKTIESLLDKKLIKKGAKDKASGSFRYTVSKAGEKHLSTISPS